MIKLCLLLLFAVALPDGVQVQRNIAYDHYPATVLDVYQPKDNTQTLHPGVVFFHGGGWIRGTKDSGLDSYILPYLEHGYVVASVEYRVTSAAIAPAAVHDALTAVKWFADHANDYHVDPRKIVITGASAGGHLALMAGLTPEAAGLGPTTSIAAIIDGFGITDVQDLLSGAHRKSWAVDWVPAGPDQAELAKRISPLTYVRPNLPPIFIVHGEQDPTVPAVQAHRLYDALKAAGDDTELLIVPQAKHGFSPSQWPGVNETVFAFLHRHNLN